MNNKPKYKLRKFQLFSYDVWGNAKDGFEVNSIFATKRVEIIMCKREDFNTGSPSLEFSVYEPTDMQLSRAFNITGGEWDGCEGRAYYCYSKRNGKPLCEVREVQS